MEDQVVGITLLLTWAGVVAFEVYIAVALWINRESREVPHDLSICALVTCALALLICLQALLALPRVWDVIFPARAPLLTCTVSLRAVLLLMFLGLFPPIWLASKLLGWGKPGRMLGRAPLSAKLVLLVPIILAVLIQLGYRMMAAGP